MPCWILLAACGLGAIYKFSSGKKNKSPSKTAMVGTFSIIAVNTQMFSIAAVSMSVGWPDSFKSVWSWTEIFAFQIDGVTALSCYFGNASMRPNYLPGLLMPPILAAMMIALWGATCLLAKCTTKASPMKIDQSINALGVVLMSMYIAVCKATFNIFECRKNPSAPKTLRGHDGYLCMAEGGKEALEMMPAAVCGILVYVVAFGTAYTWIIARAPNAYQNNAGFRMRTNFLLHRWHPEFWYWGIFFLLRNLLCSVVPSITPDATKQILLMFGLMLPMFVAQVRAWPWRDELANAHDLVMVASLLFILVLGLTMQVPRDPGSWWSLFVELASVLTFMVALGLCLVILLHALITESGIGRKKSQHAGSRPSTSSGDSSITVMSKTMSADDKVSNIHKTLISLSAEARSDDSHLLDIVTDMVKELPAQDIKKLQWGIGMIGYHVLGDATKRPTGIVLTPVTTRTGTRSQDTFTCGPPVEGNGGVSAVTV